MAAKCPRCDGFGVEDDPSYVHHRCLHCGDYADECRCAA
jgi:hypothetical protein